MNRNTSAVIASLVLVTLTIIGLFYLAKEVLHLYGDLGAQFMAISLLVIAASFIIAGGLRRSAESAQRHYKLQSKLQAYCAYLQAVVACKGSISRDTACDLVLWASPRVLRVIDARPADGSSGAPQKEWLIRLVREFRQDLGQSNIQLKLDNIIDDLMANESEGTDGCKLS